MKDVFLKLCVIALVLFITGCEQSMSRKGRTKPLQEDTYFNNGSSACELVEGVVPVGGLKQATPYFTGLDENYKEVKYFPVKISRNMLEEGRKKFNTFCAVCHDRTGRGEGSIVRRGFTKPPSYHSEKLRSSADGHFFKVMTHGFGDMPSYADVLDEYSRWEVAAYIRALQKSQNSDIGEAPEEVRKKLESQEQFDKSSVYEQ